MWVSSRHPHCAVQRSESCPIVLFWIFSQRVIVALSIRWKLALCYLRYNDFVQDVNIINLAEGDCGKVPGRKFWPRGQCCSPGRLETSLS